MGVCNCSMFCTLLYVHSSIAIILMGKRELVALLNLSSWCLMMVERLFLAVPRGCLRFVIVVFPDHTHYFCFICQQYDTALFGNSEAVQVIFITIVLVQFNHKMQQKHMNFIIFPNNTYQPSNYTNMVLAVITAHAFYMGL